VFGRNTAPLLGLFEISDFQKISVIKFFFPTSDCEAFLFSTNEDEKWVAEKERKGLYIDPRSGIIVDLLGEFEACFAKHVVHRSILARQTAAARTSERELRPGILTLDMDFAENGEIGEARKLQSEHWLTKGFAL